MIGETFEDKKVVITGGMGFLGSYLVETVRELGGSPFYFSSSDFDLRNPVEVNKFFNKVVKFDTDILFNLAANVGGIQYNQKHPYTLFIENLAISTSLINFSLAHKVKKFVQIGTTCSYPKHGKVPFSEKTIFDGFPEETNAPYGIAKRAAMVMLHAAHLEYGFNGINLIPTNLYGPRDNFEETRSHVIPALIKRFHEAKENNLEKVKVWGSGNATRDFLYVQDAAQAIALAGLHYDRTEPLNIGSGREVRISALAHKIKEAVGFEGSIEWDYTKPDGQPRRVLDIFMIKESLGWNPSTSLEDGLKSTYDWFLGNTS